MVHDFLPRIAGGKACAFCPRRLPGVGGIDASLGGLSQHVHSTGNGDRPGFGQLGGVRPLRNTGSLGA